MCSTDNFLSPIFFRTCKVWSMLHHGSVGRVQNKEWQFIFAYSLLAFFYVFHQKMYAFIIFISFFDEVSKFRNRKLTNHKQDLVIRNYQCQCI